MELRRKAGSIVIIGVHAPGENADAQEFYSKLTDVPVKVKINKEFSLLENLNATDGRRQSDKVIGAYGVEKVNKNGQLLVKLCESHYLKVPNGFFPHEGIHKLYGFITQRDYDR